MKAILRMARRWSVGLAAGAALLVLTPAALAAGADVQSAPPAAQAQEPHNLAQTWREVRSGEAHYTSIKGVERGVLIQSSGETWRELRNGPISLYGGILLAAVVAGIGVFYKMRGRIMLSEPLSGRMMERFDAVDRFAHWGLAGSFTILALSGLLMLFGKHVLLPIFGYTLFSWLATLAKTLHNFVGPLFILSVALTFVRFVRDNLPRAHDLLWLKKFGGLVSGEHVPSDRFNAGEKTWFWLGVGVLGATVGATGLILDFPNFEQLRSTMQTSHIIHVTGAILFIALSLGHIYIGTVGMEGALDSMKTGYCDEAWAKEHHEYWYNDHINDRRIAAGEVHAPAAQKT